MPRFLRILLILLLIPIFLIGFTVVHEMGHTILARILGDPASTFYLAKIEEDSACLGCNIYDYTKLTSSENLLVSAGGLLATQIVAIMLLLFSKTVAGTAWITRLSGRLALGFAFLDITVQGIQGLLYNIEQHTWPTNVDPMDIMLLISAETGASQTPMKIALAGGAAAYLLAFTWLHRYWKNPSQDPVFERE